MRVSVFITAALGVVLAGVAIASAANHPVIERVNAALTQANGTSAHDSLSHSPILHHTHSHSPILRHTHSRSPIFDPGVRPTTSEYNPTPKPVFSVGPYTSARPILMGGPYMPPNVSSHGTVTSLSSSSAVDTPGVLPTMMAAGDDEPSYGPDYDESAPAITSAPAISPTKTVAGRAAAADDEPSYAFPSYGDYSTDVFSDDDDFATGPPPYGTIPTDALIKRYAEQHGGDIQRRGGGGNGCFSPCFKFVKKYCRFLCHRQSIRAEATAAAAGIIEARRNRNRYSKTSSTTDRYTDHYTEDGTSTYAFPTTSAAPTTCNGCLDVSYPLCMEICNRE